MTQEKLLHGWDSVNKEWVKLQVDANGYVKVDLSSINLNDLADLDASAPNDEDVLTWDDALSKWVPAAAAAAGGLDHNLLYGTLGGRDATTYDIGKSVGVQKIGHSIVPLMDVTLTIIALLVSAKTSTPGTLYCRIYDDLNNTPNDVITNGEATIVEGSVGAAQYNWFTFATPPSLTAATKYWVMYEAPDGTDLKYYTVRTFAGFPDKGLGFWGGGTVGKFRDAGGWGDRDPPLDIIYGV